MVQQEGGLLSASTITWNRDTPPDGDSQGHTAPVHPILAGPLLNEPRIQVFAVRGKSGYFAKRIILAPLMSASGMHHSQRAKQSLASFAHILG